MPEAVNINNAVNLNVKRITGKLSFDQGEVFQARVVNVDEEKNEVILKTKDGWQFPARIEKPLENFPDGVVKFQVEGIENGVIKLAMVNAQDKPDKDNDEEDILTLLQDENIDVSKEDMALIDKMVKHAMPLTKENISKIKTIYDFLSKMKSEDGFEEEFVSKFAKMNGIDLESEEGKNIKNVLSGFFDELKSADIDEVITLLENNIDLTEGNLKSFNNLFKKDSAIYNTLKSIENLMNNSSTEENKNIKNNSVIQNTEPENNINIVSDGKDEITPKDIVQNADSMPEASSKEAEAAKTAREVNVQSTKSTETQRNQIFNAIKEYTAQDVNVIINRSDVENIIDLYEQNNGKNEFTVSNKIKDKLDSLIDHMVDNNVPINKKNVLIAKLVTEFYDHVVKENKNESKAQQVLNGENGKVSNEKSAAQPLKNADAQKPEVNAKGDNIIAKEAIVKGSNESLNTEKTTVKNIMKNNTAAVDQNNAAEVVKSEIKLKENEMKNIIKEVLSSNSDISKVINVIKENANDFKVFNSISNQYYYMDVPINYNDREYGCKLIIKDDRKSGKKIDSKNVKMVLSVKTISMGTVDAYMKALGSKLNVVIKCNEPYLKIFEMSKDKLAKMLKNINYEVSIGVEQKKDEVSITNTREFFNDGTMSSINVLA